jgi:hypothetical protein
MSVTENDAKTAIESILSRGLLRIRNMCLQYPSLAEVEADHIHNLPHTLQPFSLELLRFYHDVSQPGYLVQCRRSGVSYDQGHEADWQIIRQYLDAQRENQG